MTVASIKTNAESTWAGRVRNCSPSESLKKPCSKALTILAHTRLRAKSALGFLEFYPKGGRGFLKPLFKCCKTGLPVTAVACEVVIFFLKGSNQPFQRLVYFLLPRMMFELFGTYGGYRPTSYPTVIRQDSTSVRVVLFFTSWHFAVCSIPLQSVEM